MPNKKVGELELIRCIRKAFPKKRREILTGIGDDAMVFKNGMVVSTDSFVEGIHFNLQYFNFYQLGFRCMAGSLSDLAAMASEPVCALISLYLPKMVHKREITELYRGFRAIGDRFKIDIAGGDIIGSPFWGVTLTVIGTTRKPLLRSGARPGDGLYVTGYLGLSETGRLALAKRKSARWFPASIRRHRFPIPRVYEALRLRPYATAGIDTSDGLSTDALHLAEESKVRIVIDRRCLPIHPEVARMARWLKTDPVRFVLSSGEDFELLFTARRRPLSNTLLLTRIGEVRKGRGLWLAGCGRDQSIEPSGYEHLSGSK
jgi:thiamine-monophosphate kinase